jgi:hypothetical protein
MGKKLIQQGDVLFFSEEKLPKGLRPVRPYENGLYIFALGEATGHHHSAVADNDIELFQDEKGTLFCRVKGDEVVVRHQEHKPVTLKKGTWRVGIVKEVDPFSEEINRVRD